jgi:hypothetical protein
MPANILPSEEITQTIEVPAQCPRPRSLLTRVVAWIGNCADYYAAAAMYEQLSAFSDAELMRRGLSRATLAHDVRATCDRRFEP